MVRREFFFAWIVLLRLFSPIRSPLLVANLWDVTDRDIDKFSQTVFDSLRLTPARGEEEGVSVVTAVAQAREACKLKYLTGAAPIVYGIPFYL
jgi:separase